MVSASRIFGVDEDPTLGAMREPLMKTVGSEDHRTARGQYVPGYPVAMGY